MSREQTKDKCDLCGKGKKNFECLVWYSEWTETNLCKSCYLKWCKNKEHRSLEKKYKKAKPTTKEWHKKCVELQKAFNKWFEEIKSKK